MDFKLGLFIHQKLFPKATARSQILQLNEEIKEYETAECIGDKHEELGDVINVIVSLMRFEETKNIAKVLMRYYYFNRDPDERAKRMKYYEKSLKKCKERVSQHRYEFTDGLYKRSKVDINV